MTVIQDTFIIHRQLIHRVLPPEWADELLSVPRMIQRLPEFLQDGVASACVVTSLECESIIRLDRIPAVEVLFHLPSSLRKGDIGTVADLKEKYETDIAKAFVTMQAFLATPAASRQYGSEVAIVVRDEIMSEELLSAIRLAREMNFDTVTIHFFADTSPLADVLPNLGKSLWNGLRLSRFEDFHYKQVMHWEIGHFGVRLQVWTSLLRQPWYRLSEDDWLIAALSREEMQSPTLNVLPSNVCNARCPYCVSEALGRKSPRLGAMDYHKLERVSKFAKRRGGKIANISGGGEPTLSPELVKIIRVLRRHFDEVVLHTNGSRLMMPYAAGITLLQASIEAGITGISLHRVAVNDDENFTVMGLAQRYHIQDVIALAHRESVWVQLSCILLNDHVGTIITVKHFLEWAASIHVDRVVFRELLSGLPIRPEVQPVMETYYDEHRVSISLIELLAQRDPQLEFVKATPWGEKGVERLFHYHASRGTEVEVRILHGQWYQREQTSSQVSGFIFRAVQDRWGLYAGWVTETDRLL